MTYSVFTKAILVMILELFPNLSVMKKVLLLCFTMVPDHSIPPVMAQKRTISGLVTEKSTNEPLPGVSVVGERHYTLGRLPIGGSL
jgi:hypothetical protein